MKRTVYVIANTAEEAMQFAEEGRFVRSAERHTIVQALLPKVWTVEVEITAISAIKKKEA